jgi:hypothetical protein
MIEQNYQNILVVGVGEVSLQKFHPMDVLLLDWSCSHGEFDVASALCEGGGGEDRLLASLPKPVLCRVVTHQVRHTVDIVSGNEQVSALFPRAITMWIGIRYHVDPQWIEFNKQISVGLARQLLIVDLGRISTDLELDKFRELVLLFREREIIDELTLMEFAAVHSRTAFDCLSQLHAHLSAFYPLERFKSWFKFVFESSGFMESIGKPLLDELQAKFPNAKEVTKEIHNFILKADVKCHGERLRKPPQVEEVGEPASDDTEILLAEGEEGDKEEIAAPEIEVEVDEEYELLCQLSKKYVHSVILFNCSQLLLSCRLMTNSVLRLALEMEESEFTTIWEMSG